MKGPWSPCKCGGKYMLDASGSKPAAFHTLPMCERYLKADTLDELTKFSRENRHAVGIFAPEERN